MKQTLINRREFGQGAAALSAASYALNSLSRRQFLSLGAGGAALAIGQAAEPKPKLGVVIHSYGMRRSSPAREGRPRFYDPRDFLEHCAKLDAAGIQTNLGRSDPAFTTRLRMLAEKHGMYVEGITSLPRDEADVPRFEAELRI